MPSPDCLEDINVPVDAGEFDVPLVLWPLEKLPRLDKLPGTTQFIPTKVADKLKVALALLLERHEEAMVNGEDDLAEMWAKKFLLAPTVCLTHKKGKSVRKSVKDAVDLILDDDWESFTLRNMFDIPPGVNTFSFKKPRKTGRIVKPIRAGCEMTAEHKRCLELASNGMLGRAYRALVRTDAVVPGPEVKAKLVKLHPKRPSHQSFTPEQLAFKSDVHVNFTANDVRHHIHTLGKLVAPGLSKFRFGHIRQLLGGTNDDNGNRFLSALTPFLLRIARGTLCDAVGKFLSFASLIALSKGDGKVRPIALGDSLRKIAMGVALGQFSAKIKSHFRGLQFGMSRLGCEIIFHKSVTCSQLHPEYDRIFVDATNAFNQMNRVEALTQLIEHFPELVGYFIMFYGKDTDLWYGEDIIKAEIGVQQGDVFAPFVYALSIHWLLMKANEMCVNDDEFTVGLFDDVTTHAVHDVAFNTLKFIKEHGKKNGYEVNDKTVVLLGIAESCAIAKERKAKYMTLLDSQNPNTVLIHPVNSNSASSSVEYGTRLLGGPVGSKDFCNKWLTEHITSLEESARLITDIPHTQLQWCLFYHVMCKKFNHILRYTAPDTLLSYLGKLDVLLLDTFQSIIGTHITPYVWTQCKTSIVGGGLGIPDVFHTAVAAHTASCLEVLPFLTSSTSLDALTDTEWFHDLSMCIDVFNTYTSSLPDSTLDLDKLVQECLVGSGRDKLQHRLSLSLSTIRDVKYLDSIPLDDDINRCRVISSSNSESGSFITVYPRNDYLLSNEEYKALLCFRLGIKQHFINPNQRCHCEGRPLIGVHGEHCHQCALHGVRNGRHTCVNKTLKDMMGMAGVRATDEPKDLFLLLDNNHKRPDLIAPNLYTHPRKCFLGDVAIVHPPGSAYLGKGSSTTKGAAARSMFGTKSCMYSKMITAKNYEIQPLIFESFGLFHPTVKLLVNHVCSLMSSLLGVAFPILKKYWTNRISIANMRGTARMLLSANLESVKMASVDDLGCFDAVDKSLDVFASSSFVGD